MSGVPPAPPRPPAGAPATPEPAVKGTLVSAPEALAELPAGSLLRGLVAGRGAGGTIVIATALGDLEVAARNAPAALRTVLVQLPSGSGGALVILPQPAEGDRPPTPPSVQPPPSRPAAGDRGGAATELRVPAAGPQDTVGRQPAITATVLAGPAPGEAANRPGMPELRPGARIAVRVLSLLSETPPPIGAAGRPAAAPGGLPANPPAADAPVIKQPVPALERSGAPVPVRPTPAAPAQAAPTQAITAPRGPQAGPAGASAAPPPPGPSAAPAPQRTVATPPESIVAGTRPLLQPMVDGRVTATTRDGRVVVATPLGKLLLAPQAGLAAGDRVGLALQLPAAGPRPAAAEPANRGWPALVEALQVLATEEAGPAAGPPSNAGPAELVPRTGPRLGSGLLFLMSALSGGSLPAWLGSGALERLERLGRAELVTRLGQEFNQMSRQAETPGGDWRLLALPLVHEGAVMPVHFYLRRKPARPGDDSGPRATRFVVELALSRLGELQLDGLVTGERFDLILRSRRPLGSRLRSDIAAIFQEANAITGAKGRIGFQTAEDWAAIEPAGSHPAERGPNLVI